MRGGKGVPPTIREIAAGQGHMPALTASTGIHDGVGGNPGRPELLGFSVQENRGNRDVPRVREKGLCPLFDFLPCPLFTFLICVN